MSPSTAPDITDIATLHCLWAKLERDQNAPPAYHPLICHLIDVGSAAEAIWRDAVSPWTKRRITTAFGLPDEDATGRWIAFIVATHDVGKACPPFQHRKETPQTLRVLLDAARLKESATPPPSEKPVSHGAVSERTLRDDLVDLFGLSKKVAAVIATAVGGHHGRFHGASTVDDFGDSILGKARWTAARRTLLRTLEEQFIPPLSTPPNKIDNAAAMWLAGLVSAADWIGSNADYFTYKVPDLRVPGAAPPTFDIGLYQIDARIQAEKALNELGWKGHTVAASGLTPLTFAELFPFARPPAPVQTAVVDLAAVGGAPGDGPSLAVIEAPMGEGKTEAALYLLDHWATRGQVGAYVGLPSQATSNQMFGRVRSYLTRRYDDADGAVTLQLLHGHAALSAEFALLKEEGAKLYAPSNIDADGEKEPASDADQPSVVAAEWFTHRKQGLLAPFGVGTVDQALMAVLSAKHVFVRLFGLGGKTVVIDEVHAYDTYMSVLLERLLAWLGALGCSVVLLSATLPSRRRDALVAAFIEGATGVRHADQPRADNASYPRITWATTGAVPALRGAHIAASKRSQKDLRLVHLSADETAVGDDPSAPFPLVEKLRAALAEGGCAAVICNTVKRAQQVYAALAAHFVGHDDAPALSLLHAQMPFDQRQRREQEALVCFGKQDATVDIEGVATPVARPPCAVLVSTQIIEQSLDLDFDLMVSDLAPIDLLLQRSGRLHRHERTRSPGLETATLWLCAPALDGDGIPTFARHKTSIVYANHILLKTWLQVRDRARIAVPANVEALIEAVYGDDAPPAGLAPAWIEAWAHTLAQLEKETEHDEHQGDIRVIKNPHETMALDKLAGHLRQEDAPELSPAQQAVTRLARPSIGLICLWGDIQNPTLDREGRQPYNRKRIPDLATTKNLLRRSLQVTHPGLVKQLGDPDAPGVKPYMPVDWGTSALLRSFRLIVFDAQQNASVDIVSNGVVKPLPLHLDETQGLLIGPRALRQHTPDDEEGD